jgi:tyrosinase
MQSKHPDQLPRRHTFTPTQKFSYLSAELCLMHTPARQNLTGALTLFDELAASHQSQSPYMHFVGAFLPWHRALIWAHETALRTRCNYTGAQPYWAEERDAGAFGTSEILAEFGGDGVGEEGCIAAGPFANYTSSIGPGYANTPHCIQRQVNETFSALSAERFVDACMRETTWEGAWPCIENEPHAGGHGGVGRLASTKLLLPFVLDADDEIVDARSHCKPWRSLVLSAPRMAGQVVGGLAGHGSASPAD